MTQDRATREFMELFKPEARSTGHKLHSAGNVLQIYGSHIFIEGKVRDGDHTFMTALKLSGDEWLGYCDGKASLSAPVYATLLERIEQGERLAEKPEIMDGRSIYQVAEARLDRNLSPEEEQYLSKLEKRWHRYEATQEIYDHDIVRLNSAWPIDTYDPLSLWPTPPDSILEFWNYIAHAFESKKLRYPKFMECLTETGDVSDRIKQWNRENDIRTWRETVVGLNKTAPAPTTRSAQLRLMVTTATARLQILHENEDSYTTIESPADLTTIETDHRSGLLTLDLPSELLWLHTSAFWKQSGNHEMALDDTRAAESLNALFQLDSLKNLLVTLDEEPFRFEEHPLHWNCIPPADPHSDQAENTDWQIRLETAQGQPIPHSLRLLPGKNHLYLSDDLIFNGPAYWGTELEVAPQHNIPPEILETSAGVSFLARIGAGLPDDLSNRVSEAEMIVQLDLALVKRNAAVDSEVLTCKITAADNKDQRTETLDKEGWQTLTEPQATGNQLIRFDRSVLYHFPAILEPMRLAWDNAIESFRGRVTRQFPEKFTEWINALPDGIHYKTDDQLTTLLDDPVDATVKFEVAEAETGIDWFDLKVVVNIEGHDLTDIEIRNLINARGGFVRMKNKGWLRLNMKLSDGERNAIDRLGLDPYDLSKTTHRMHALQLAEAGTKEVFNTDTWDTIRDRAATLQLQINPTPSDKLTATLRPYQIEGFHFLSYLATNSFGGILADDMGLGKTIQSITWILWLRERKEEAGEPVEPVLVVAPKSVLDVWAGEIEKFAASLSVQVLRQKEELDIEEVKKNIDVLVINYAQLRSCIDQLKEIPWITTILDEGQQIKNPDSKAAKAARQLTSDNRLVLTGTPIENRLLDVWSLMSFAMPGVLGDRAYFRDRFDRRKDVKAHLRLSSRLRPFILRRTKGQVAVDLPPRTEEEVMCKMEPEQEKLYFEQLETTRKQLLGFDSNTTLRRNSIAVLQGLMRLRQICCHPELIDPQFAETESAKHNALIYLLDQLREEGHKVLVFSQFTSMLDIIQRRLEEHNHPHCILTGKTENRGELVKNFQSSKDPDVFLLSLKAGGSGLNLTAASYVILYDPWWNPAVEAQAIDRTHRIGQTNKVMAYRLITRDTVEEKIRRLQQRKQDLASGVLGEESFGKTLDLDDLRYLLGTDD